MARTHGRVGTYNDGCRCADCRHAATVWHRERRYRNRQPTTLKHRTTLCIGCFRMFAPCGYPEHERACLADA